MQAQNPEAEKAQSTAELPDLPPETPKTSPHKDSDPDFEFVETACAYIEQKQLEEAETQTIPKGEDWSVYRAPNDPEVVDLIEELLKSDEEDDQQKQNWEKENEKFAQPERPSGKRAAEDRQGDNNKKRRVSLEDARSDVIGLDTSGPSQPQPPKRTWKKKRADTPRPRKDSHTKRTHKGSGKQTHSRDPRRLPRESSIPRIGGKKERQARRNDYNRKREKLRR